MFMKYTSPDKKEEKKMLVITILIMVFTILAVIGSGYMLISGIDKYQKGQKAIEEASKTVEYEAEVKEGVCKEMGIDNSDIKDVELIMDRTYIVTTKNNSYLVSINIEDGKVTYVDVETSLLEV